MRARFILFTAAAIVIAALILLSLLDSFFVDLLWFRSLSYGGVFATMVGAQVGIFVAVWVVAFGFLCASGLSALRLSRERERLHVVRRPDEVLEINLPELIRSLGERVPWHLLVVAASAVLAIFVAGGEAAGWDTWIKAWYAAAAPFHLSEAAFGNDVGFYVFVVPWLEDVRDLFLVILFLVAALTGVVYWARGALDFSISPPRISSSAAAHFSLLLGLFFIQRALNYWLGRFGLLYDNNGVVFGLRYVDSLLWRPGLWLLAGLALVAGALCVANMRWRGVRLPVLAALAVFGPSMALSLLQPLIEKLWVKPDELRIERPYLVRNIEMTRHAYQLNNFSVKPFAATGTLTPASLAEDSPTIKNIRLWDPRPLIATYRQLQEIRLYYDFTDVDIDRYTINGEYTQVMLSARELNTALLPENARTWVNQHLKYTHGSGLAMSPVNQKSPEGLPVFFVRDIPPTSTVGLEISRPGIYFGQESDSYAVVKSATSEFDYPRGAENVYSFYQGDAGIRVSGLLRRLLFSYYFRDLNLLVTENVLARSRILIRRNISDRIARIAPFLIQDRDPYMAIHNGALVWIVDCYTSSDHYPYSRRINDQINYMRNSVKVVIDAYTGQTDFYVADPEDPVVLVWQRIFPTLFKPLSAMPPDLRKHIRYPEDLFLIQAEIYRTYHMTDPQVFYNREDQWGFPRENYGGETVTMRPYYVIMRLPGEPEAEYMLMIPMCPQGRDNMIAWLAARCDGDDYGHLFEFAFSKDVLFYGPYQIQARINQNPDISRQLSLWNQMGSKVILGNLIVIPVRQSLLYVEPLYIRAENGQLPELQRVIASYADRVVMGETLQPTLAALFEGPGAPAAVVAPVVAKLAPAAETGTGPAALGPAKGGAAEARAALEGATAHYDRALNALRAGDWAAFGNEMQMLGKELGPPRDRPHQ